MKFCAAVTVGGVRSFDSGSGRSEVGMLLRNYHRESGTRNRILFFSKNLVKLPRYISRKRFLFFFLELPEQKFVHPRTNAKCWTELSLSDANAVVSSQRYFGCPYYVTGNPERFYIVNVRRLKERAPESAIYLRLDQQVDTSSLNGTN